MLGNLRNAIHIVQIFKHVTEESVSIEVSRRLEEHSPRNRFGYVIAWQLDSAKWKFAVPATI
jgi:hypothetical protein